jgi:ubiquinone/menaquinone biosynthesis C-methylase UbiE
MRNIKNADKSYYDTQIVNNIPAFAKKISLYFSKYENLIINRFGGKKNIQILEMGAGSCTLSLLISKYKFVSKVVCYDISFERMKSIVESNAKNIDSDFSKLEFVEGDFSNIIPFDNDCFDIILFDASLHHTRSMWNTLDECRRVLKKGGVVIAQRETTLGMFTSKIKMKRLLETEEVKMGVSENAYLKEQYEYYFRANGFSTKFISMAETFMQKLLLPLNGFLFSKWIIIAYAEK